MTKVTIYLSLQDGKLYYRDSEDNSGDKITTPVKPGTKIEWRLDKNSGINNLTGINIDGDANFFKKGPCKEDWDCWSAQVGKETEGTISYELFFTKDESDEASVVAKKSAAIKSDGSGSKIIVRI